MNGDVGRRNVPWCPVYHQWGNVRGILSICGAHNSIATRTVSCDPTLLQMRLIRREEDYPPSIVKTAMHNVGWMFPFALLPYFDQFLDTHGGERRNETLLCIMINE